MGLRENHGRGRLAAVDTEDGTIRARVAETLFERMRGLIGRPPPAPGEGLLIEKCNAIHTFFMRYPVDAIFLDRENRPVKTVRGIRPWRPFVWGGWKARKVLETASGPRRGVRACEA